MAEQLHRHRQPVGRPGRFYGRSIAARPIRGCLRWELRREQLQRGAWQFSQTSNNITLANDFGDQYQRYNGVLLNVSARLGKGLTFQGGVNTGKRFRTTAPCARALPGSSPSPASPGRGRQSTAT
jgi:hypothetical protein